jgi:hypothetical protein
MAGEDFEDLSNRSETPVRRGTSERAHQAGRRDQRVLYARVSLAETTHGMKFGSG